MTKTEALERLLAAGDALADAASASIKRDWSYRHAPQNIETAKRINAYRAVAREVRAMEVSDDA